MVGLWRRSLWKELIEGLILVKDTPKGRGIFVSRDVPARTVLDISPVLFLDPMENEEHIKNTELYNYTYEVQLAFHSPKSKKNESNGSRTPPTTTQAVIFGLGSMFNHSNIRQNVGWKRDLTNRLITYTALRGIKKGEELCISYRPRLTFKDTETETDELNEGHEDWTEVLNMIDLID